MGEYCYVSAQQAALPTEPSIPSTQVGVFEDQENRLTLMELSRQREME